MSTHLRQRIIRESFILTQLVFKCFGKRQYLFRIKYVIRKEPFSDLLPFKIVLPSLSLCYSIFQKVVASAKKNGVYDLIIVDADIIFDEDKTAPLDLADKYIFICNDFNKEDNAPISPNIALRFS